MTCPKNVPKWGFAWARKSETKSAPILPPSLAFRKGVAGNGFLEVGAQNAHCGTWMRTCRRRHSAHTRMRQGTPDCHPPTYKVQLTAALPYKPLSPQLARSAAPRQCRSGCGGAAPPRPAVHLLSPRAPADLPVKSPVILPRSKRRSFLNSYPPKQRTASQFYGCSSRWDMLMVKTRLSGIPPLRRLIF